MLDHIPDSVKKDGAVKLTDEEVKHLLDEHTCVIHDAPDRFLSNPSSTPPDRYSAEELRRNVIRDAIDEGSKLDLGEAILKLERNIEENASGVDAELDKGLLALGALRRVQEERKARKKRLLRRWLLWFPLLLCLLGGAGAYIYQYFLETRQVGSYNVPQNCSIKFGDNEITGLRTYTFYYTSFFGYHLIDESRTSEKTILNDNGTPFVILEIDSVKAFQDGNAKWKRQNVTKGGKGNIYLKNAEMYMFVGQKDNETAVSSYKGLCQG